MTLVLRGFCPTGRILVVLAVAASGCSLHNGRAQLVQVRSTPPGAAVFLDGEPAGVTPLEVEVRRRNADPMLRIEKSGFAPADRELDRGLSGWFAADLGLASLFAAALVFGAGSDGSPVPAIVGSGALGAGIVLVPVLATGSAFSFRDEVHVTLAPTEERSHKDDPMLALSGRSWSSGPHTDWLGRRDRWGADGAGLRKRVRAVWMAADGRWPVPAGEQE